MYCLPLIAAACCCGAALRVAAEVRVDPLFADHMIVQRDAAVSIRGTLAPGDTVKVAFAREGADAVPIGAIVRDGVWSCDFPAHAASAEPWTFRIVTPAGERVIRDVLIGDIWVCAGQSNMEFPLSREMHAKAILQGPSDPKVRILHHAFAGQYVFGTPLTPEDLAKLTPALFYEGGWKTDSAEAAAPASAIGYCFARRIVRDTGVPVGIVDYAIGGAPIETFVDAGTLAEHFPAKTTGDWTKNPALDAWSRGRASVHLGGRGAPADGTGPEHAYKPGFAWRAGPAKLAGFPVAGVLWYQGETNAIGDERVAEYPALFATLVADWRERWRNPGLPFYFAQLSSCGSPPADRALWGDFRDGQRRAYLALKTGNTGSVFGKREADLRRPAEHPGPVGMIVTSDVGDPRDVHPRDKLTVADRFARRALRDVYGKTGTTVSGPVAVAASLAHHALVVRFEPGTAAGLKPVSGSKLAGFEIAGIDGKFVPAEATVKDDTLVVTGPKRLRPKTVRYAWKPVSDGNLVNAAGLPASTFRLGAD